MSKPIIIIPIYKIIPDKTEIISLHQCIKVLRNYPICIITHNSLNVSFYRSELQKSGIVFTFEYFDESFFNDVSGYNRLMLSVDFYQRFKNYEYMLIYQLDAYVFRDELEYWCDKGYDYIGAPWFEGWHGALPNSPFVGVGNGGLSLRKIKKVNNLVQVLNLYIAIYKYLSKNKLLNRIIDKNIINYFYIAGYNYQNEDFLIFNLSKRFKWFKIASYSEAYKFSFDVNPEVLYKINNNKLPFGCHGWQRYQYEEFWKQFINV